MASEGGAVDVAEDIDALVERQREERLKKNGRTPSLSTGFLRSRTWEMRRTIGRLARQCDLIDEQSHLLDIAIDNGIHITRPEYAARHAQMVATHYRLQCEEVAAKRDALLAALAAAEGRVATLVATVDRWREDCDGEYRARVAAEAQRDANREACRAIATVNTELRAERDKAEGERDELKDALAEVRARICHMSGQASSTALHNAALEVIDAALTPKEATDGSETT